MEMLIKLCKKVLAIMIVLSVIGAVIFCVLFADMMYSYSKKEKEEKVTQTSAVIEKVVYASPERSCTCLVDTAAVDESVKMVGFTNNGHLKLAEVVYDSLVSDNKILLLKENTKVECYYSEKYSTSYGDFIPVIFLEGKFKGRRAYILSVRLQEK